MTQTINISTASGRRKRKRKKAEYARTQKLKKKLDALCYMVYTYLKLTEYTAYIRSSYVQVQSPFVVYLTCVGNQIL